MTSFPDPIHLPSWIKLQSMASDFPKNFNLKVHMNEERAKKYSINIDISADCNLFLDYSKNLVSDDILSTLLQLISESGVEEQRNAMFNGVHINNTEDRAVMHTSLRRPSQVRLPGILSGNDENKLIQKELGKMRTLANSILNGKWQGHAGDYITDIVNIGIGGSDLGPKMVCTALEPYYVNNEKTGQPMKMHFVSNVDGWDLERVLLKVNASTTLFVIVSKTFTTQETMTNAASARSWFSRKTNNADISKHFVAVSTNREAVAEFGIPNDDFHIFGFWDWVGGRYSLWSAVGLSICIAIGADQFGQLLEGAHAMDCHFLTSSPSTNAPMLLALLGIWYNNFLNCETQAILPYEQSLEHFSKYLQQLEMESNGKNVTRNGIPIQRRWQTGPIIWGEAGTNGQHAFYQLLHQGTKVVPVDFLGGASPMKRKDQIEHNTIDREKHHALLLANMIAQSEALMTGEAGSSFPTYRKFEGNRPSTTILYSPFLNPKILGGLVALYEHKVFVQGIIWNINSFDQWGVELGKKLANRILAESSPSAQGQSGLHDASTVQLLKKCRKHSNVL